MRTAVRFHATRSRASNKRPTRLIAWLCERFRSGSERGRSRRERENKSTRIGVLGSTSNDTIVVVVTAPLARLRFCPEQLPPLSPAALRASFSSCRSQRERASEAEREREGARRSEIRRHLQLAGEKDGQRTGSRRESGRRGPGEGKRETPKAMPKR